MWISQRATSGFPHGPRNKNGTTLLQVTMHVKHLGALDKNIRYTSVSKVRENYHRSASAPHTAASLIDSFELPSSVSLWHWTMDLPNSASNRRCQYLSYKEFIIHEMAIIILQCLYLQHFRVVGSRDVIENTHWSRYNWRGETVSHRPEMLWLSTDITCIGNDSHWLWRPWCYFDDYSLLQITCVYLQ